MIVYRKDCDVERKIDDLESEFKRNTLSGLKRNDNELSEDCEEKISISGEFTVQWRISSSQFFPVTE